jgi:hypothetical protein
MRSSSSDGDSQAHAVKPPTTWTLKEPESFVTETEDYSSGHPVISQKKKAKKAREAKRKAKKQDASEEVVNENVDGKIDEETRVSAQDFSTPPETKLETEVENIDKKPQTSSMKVNSDDKVAKVATEPILRSIDGVSPAPPHEPMPATKHGKHMHWVRFTRNFIADQLTNPYSPSWSGCSHGTSCSFETNNVLDCPFHEPCKNLAIAFWQLILTQV